MEREILTLHIEGMPANQGDMQLSAFIDKLDAFRSILQESDRATKSPSQKALEFLVVDLSHSSPAAISIATPAEADRFTRTADTFLSILTGINSDTFSPTSFSYPVLEKLEKLTVGFKDKFSRLWFSRRGVTVVAITDDTRDKIKDLLLKSIYSIGTVKGRVERYNSHSDDKHFYVYPILGREVKCFFSEELREKASEAVEHNVTVEGLLRFREGDFFPYDMEAHSIDIHPADTALPSLTSLIGLSPGATGGQVSSDFISEKRDEWH